MITIMLIHLLNNLKTFYMKKIFFICSMAAIAFGCNNNAEGDSKPGDTTKMSGTTMSDPKKENLNLPYTTDHPYAEWKPGDEQHAVTVMKGLKAFENGDINTCMEAFGDSVRMGFDYFQAKMSKDSVKAMLTKQRGMYSSIKVKMDDWESVISADKKDEWVTLWYKQWQTDKTGHIDSLGVVDDAKIVNGKIVVLDEKIQHLGPPKK
jgi:hypothetical protein